VSGVPLREHLAALRDADRALAAERDRRYAEVAAEREKALKIKEAADEAALLLAREIQTYKDEKANELRSQIESERGGYATKDDLASAVREIRAELAPVASYVSGDAGRKVAVTDARLSLGTVIGVIGALVALVTLYLYATRK
jgi:hypothetical protein